MTAVATIAPHLGQLQCPDVLRAKMCNTCGEPKPAADFHKRAASPDGLCYTCKTCAKKRALEHHEAHRAKANAARKQRREANLEASIAKSRAWREANQERSRQIVRDWIARNRPRKAAADKAWRARNGDKVSWHGRERREAIRRATPAWADLSAIRDVYQLAACLREVTGDNYHVDHVVPLRGKNVCGLHVAANLEVVLAADNLKKGARFEEVA